ncbi:MAG: FAD-binding protein [Dehalococcoidia bacterium]|nr:FAD-binding protein [Dehalococcoidia bacterium]
MSVTWDRETDVIIAGYGLSGAVAAIEASDAGAEVIILEKSQFPGGLSILAGGSILCVSDPESAAGYLAHLSGGRIDENLIAPFARGLSEIEPYMRKLAEVNGGKVTASKSTIPGGIGEGLYPFPGQEAFYRIRVTEIPGFTGFTWVQHLRMAALNMMKVVMDNVDKRNVPCLFSTAATRLVRDSAGKITGLKAVQDGKEITVRARRGIILATGGFEQNRWMQMQFLQGKPFYAMAPLTHTGDGIVMAQDVGADLWHMWHVHGSYGLKFPEFPIAFRTPFSGPRNPKRRMPWIVVDKFGRRYMNEYQPGPQDTMHRAMEIYDPDLPGYARIPSYLIFDETGRAWGPLGEPLAIGGTLYNWSKDNSDELNKGWILRGDTLAELARALAEREDNEGRMEGKRLEKTVAEWNEVVKSGEDDFHRPPGTMMPIESPPFYACPVWPIITNTQGGPVHNVKQQIVDVYKSPIPRLYACGELGSFFAHLYQLGGNIGECVYSGRVAGVNAAAEKPL